jgi:hypothetical protein
MDFLIDIVKEHGIADIISNYKYELENCEKRQKFKFVHQDILNQETIINVTTDAMIHYICIAHLERIYNKYSIEISREYRKQHADLEAKTLVCWNRFPNSYEFYYYLRKNKLYKCDYFKMFTEEKFTLSEEELLEL